MKYFLKISSVGYTYISSYIIRKEKRKVKIKLLQYLFTIYITLSTSKNFLINNNNKRLTPYITSIYIN